MRSYGAREIAAGVLSLSTEKQAGLWSRVAGDGLDVATLVSGLRNDNPQRNNVAFALMMVLGIGAARHCRRAADDGAACAQPQPTASLS